MAENTTKTKAPSGPIPSLKRAEEQRPVTNVNERNTTQDQNPTEKDVGVRTTEAVDMVVARTGQLPADVNALTAELGDQVRTEATAERVVSTAVGGRDLNTLDLERLDHAHTMQQALGLSTGGTTTEEDMARARERMEVLKKQQRDTSKDNVHNSIPANWVTRLVGEDEIEAFNTITGKEFKGKPTDLAKEFTANDSKEG